MSHRRLASFDIEVARTWPEKSDWRQVAPLGISCAAAARCDRSEPLLWQGVPQLSMTGCRQIVHDLVALVRDGYTLVTWNGCGFDFQVLAQESGLRAECAELARHHVDMMMMIVFRLGYPLGLEKALVGAGLPGKTKTVTLRDGTVHNEMSGQLAPLLWAAGEHDAVLAYLRSDVVETLRLAHLVQHRGAITWTSQRGKPMRAPFERLFTVTECRAFPEPDTSWMSNPMPRSTLTDWLDG